MTKTVLKIEPNINEFFKSLTELLNNSNSDVFVLAVINDNSTINIYLTAEELVKQPIVLEQAEFENEAELLQCFLKSQPDSDNETHYEVINVSRNELYKILAICQEKFSFCNSLLFEEVHGSKKNHVKSISLRGTSLHVTYQKTCLTKDQNEQLREKRFFKSINEPIGVSKSNMSVKKQQMDYQDIYKQLFIDGEQIRMLTPKNETS